MTNDDILAGFDDEKDESLKISLQKLPENEGCLVFNLVGYIDTYNSTYFQKKVQKAIDSGYIRLIFQCEALNYVSSTGIGSFTVFIKTLKPRGGDVVLLGIQPKVYEVFQLLGFSKFFNIKGSLEEALDFFKNTCPDEKSTGFPMEVICPVCLLKLKVDAAGRYQCSGCQAVLNVDGKGAVTLG